MLNSTNFDFITATDLILSHLNSQHPAAACIQLLIIFVLAKGLQFTLLIYYIEYSIFFIFN